jgi:hypothetical protein
MRCSTPFESTLNRARTRHEPDVWLRSRPQRRRLSAFLLGVVVGMGVVGLFR